MADEMNQEEQQAQILHEIRGAMIRWSIEYDLTYQSLYGVLVDAMFDLKLEQKYDTPIEWSYDNEYEEYEQDDIGDEEEY